MDNTDKVVNFLEDARAIGLSVLAPDVNASGYMPDSWISSSTSSHGGFVGRSAKSMPQLTGLAASLTELLMIEGGSSDRSGARTFAYQNAEKLDALIQVLVDATIDYLAMSPTWLYGINKVAPVVRRPSRASCAVRAWASGNVCPISIFTAPDASTANRAAALSSSSVVVAM